MKTKALTDLARTIRSKNAGSFFITIEIIKPHKTPDSCLVMKWQPEGLKLVFRL